MSMLEIKDLTIHYITKASTVRAVNDISLSLEKGETLGLVGETGAGKTTTRFGHHAVSSNRRRERLLTGEIIFNGVDLLKAGEHEMRKIRGDDISMIFQDPMTALNPIKRIGDQIAEVVFLHGSCTRAEAVEDGASRCSKWWVSAPNEVQRNTRISSPAG